MEFDLAQALFSLLTYMVGMSMGYLFANIQR